MNIHIPTLFLMLMVLSFTVTLSVALAARTQLRDGMAFWATGLACNTAVYVLFVLRGQISDVLSIVLANALVSCVYALFTEGILEFQKRAPRRWLIWLPVPVTAVLFSAMIHWQAGRMVVASVVYATQCSAILMLLWQRRKATVGVGQYFMVAGFLMTVLAFAMQLVGTLLHPDAVTSILTPSLVQIVLYMVSVISIVVVSVGLVVMTKERADECNRNLAMRDELTGLINRRALLESLARELATAKRHAQPLSVLIIDIDFFKRVNDTHGHLSGDNVLKGVANAIAQRTRAQDLVGRLGGEEFLVVLPNTTIVGAQQLAETLRQGVASAPLKTVSGQSIGVTVSMGLCAVSQLNDPKSDDVIGAVDQALYCAKANGRNRVEVYADACVSPPGQD